MESEEQNTLIGIAFALGTLYFIGGLYCKSYTNEIILIYFLLYGAIVMVLLFFMCYNVLYLRGNKI